MGNVTGVDVGPDQPNMMGGALGSPKPVPTQSFTPTGLPPGTSEAMKASGEQLAQERVRGGSFQRDVFPLMKALPALETLGTKGTGPGTETLNQVKSFLLSNVPGITEEKLSSVKNFDEAKKYLTDFVNQTGNSGTNDKLAAAFAGNPSVHISNAAAVDVAKSALALRRMQHARYLAFEQSGLPESEFARWNATNAVINPQVPGQPRTNYQLDPRAFGVDMMSYESRQKLKAELNKNAAEKAAFDASVKLAQDSGFITPPSGTK
jgi:hypothetical protein